MTSLSTLSTTQETAIRDWLAAHPTLSVGVGDAESACSVAAINLALSGTLTDNVPDCMSPVIGRWVINVQDEMPADIRNSAAWRDLLPLAAGTGRTHESERLALLLDWMWGTTLPLVQPIADRRGFGEAWRQMCAERTADAADAAVYTANAAYAAHAAANEAADAAAYAAAYAGGAAAAFSAATVANAAACAAYAADDYADAWATLDPVGLLRRLIAVTDPRALEASDAE